MTQEELDVIYEALDKDVNYAETIAIETVNSKTNQLDDLMKQIYTDIVCQEDPATSSIEKYFLSLSNCLYFLGENLEKIGIYDDISKAKAKEKYNNAYLEFVNPVDAKKKVTVAEAQTSAENASTMESLINTIYSRAYKIFKYKIESAQTMLSTLSKMVSKRMQDAQMSQQGAGAEIKQYLVESPFKQFRETL